MREFLKIVGLCVACAIGYGIWHDQITARICVEYFTIGHPPIFNTDSPTLLGLGWGVIATWWFGAILGTLLALAARVGRWKRLTARQLLRPVLILLACMALCAVCVGILGYRIAVSGGDVTVGQIFPRLPPERRVAFASAWAAHLSSYGSAAIGGVILSLTVFIRRLRLPRLPASPVTP